MDPKMIVLGEAPKERLEYYDGRDHVRQNTAWDITFENERGQTHVYVGNSDYRAEFLTDDDIMTLRTATTWAALSPTEEGRLRTHLARRG